MNRAELKLDETRFETRGICPSYPRKQDTAGSPLKGNNFEIANYLNGDHREKMINDILQGMIKTQKSIPSKYFYDARGSQLFEQICMTSEYYPTKTELSILDQSATAIMRFFSQEGGDLVELGSGSNQKIRKLLDVMRPLKHGRIRYVPVDISDRSLLESATELLKDYDNLEILGVLADFTRHIEALPRGRKLITFFGSTIGNLTEKEAVTFLRNVRAMMNPDDRFLLGMDMLKPIEILESAYNDGQGVTRDFNRNILTHINRELKSDFDPEDFDHLAFFDSRREQVEMHLRAKRTVNALIADLGLRVEIRKGDTIHTEICKKFSRESAGRLFQRAELSIARWFTDPRRWFSLVELQVEGTEKRLIGGVR
jgi:L-histidine N-alpha-methyltransferase